MKRIVSVMLSLLLLSSFGLTALAEESGTSSETGFSIGENPSYGEEDVIFFPSEATPEPRATEVPTTVPESPEENSIKEGNSPQEEPAAESRAEEGESETIASSPAPENETVSSKQNNYPVIIIAAVLAACAILFVIVKKRKPAKRRDG